MSDALRAFAFPLEQNDAIYLVEKSTWTGRTRLAMAFNKIGILTFEMSPWQIVNNWPWDSAIVEAYAERKNTTDFSICIRDGKKTSSITFSCDYRSDLLSDLQSSLSRFQEAGSKDSALKTTRKEFTAVKIKRGDTRLEVLLRVRDFCMEEIDTVTLETRAQYLFKNMKKAACLSESNEAFCIEFQDIPPKVYVTRQRSEVLKIIQETCLHRIGMNIESPKGPTLNEAKLERSKMHGNDEDEELVSIVEFPINKVTPRYPIAINRLLCITEKRLVERDPSNYTIVTSRLLDSIFCIHRHHDDPQRLTIQYKNDTQYTYISTNRDAIITSLLDSSRGAGNQGCYVNPLQVPRGKRILPFRINPDAEYQAIYLKILASQETSHLPIADIGRLADTFNANIPYSSANFVDKHQKLAHCAISNLLPYDMTIAEELKPMVVFAILQALRRIFSTRIGFESITSMPNLINRLKETINACMRTLNEHVNFAATELLCAMMQPSFENSIPSDDTFEQLNKKALLSSDDIHLSLIKFVEFHSRMKSGALVVNGSIDAFVYILCSPYADTTDQAIFEKIIVKVAGLNRYLYKLFHHPCLTVAKGVGMLMIAIITECETELVKKIQLGSLLDGALLRHLHAAMFTSTKTDIKLIRQRNLSRELVRLWTASNDECMSVIRRILLPGMLKYLRLSDTPPIDEDEARLLQSKKKSTETQPVVDLSLLNPFMNWHVRQAKNRRIETPRAIIRTKKVQNDLKFGNWPLLFSNISKDHTRFDLVWNYYTREELREALDKEIRHFLLDQESNPQETLSWNYAEFEVLHPSLENEPQAGDYFLRPLIENNKAEPVRVPHPKDFFQELYQRFFHEDSVESKALCLECLSIIYRNQYQEIGRFRETKFILFMLKTCVDSILRDRLLQFLYSLVLCQENARIFVDCQGIPAVVGLMTLVHLESRKSSGPLQPNLIAASESQVRAGEKEWFYYSSKEERCGPYSVSELSELWDQGKIKAKTLLWAATMEDWEPLHTIPQMRWTLISPGLGVLTYHQLGIVCLDILLSVVRHFKTRDAEGNLIRPIAKAKRQLSESTNFPHLVQMLLSFDPDVIDRTCKLLLEIIQDNSQALPKLYLTGIFYFALLYPGSNIIPIWRILKATHDRQIFYYGDNSRESSTSRSFLRTILPDAMICFLSSNEPEKYSEIFLGDFDNPEVVWTPEMRRRMIEKISLHLSNFPLRIQANNKCVYPFVPIAPINYPNLDGELFCSRYYLRNLCNTSKFPNWPMTHHTEVLQSIISEWKLESEKKGMGMTRDQAREALGLKPEQNQEDQIRRAYYKLAAKYHPDKNPEGRETFEKIQMAYEILSASSNTDGPDVGRLALLIKAQTIIYSRYPDTVEPYRYSGYLLLLKIIVTETRDPNLFKNPKSLLADAMELCYYTMKVSPLNAEEVRREGGVEILSDVLKRCVSLTTARSSDEEAVVKIAGYALLAFSVIGRFPQAREAVSKDQEIVWNMARCMHYRSAPKLIQAATVCACSFAVDSTLQIQLLQCGILWYGLSACLDYDFTLEESGIQATTETNHQLLLNQIAKESVELLCRMAGYGKGGLVTPKNELCRNSLDSLLTRFIVEALPKEPAANVLKLINTNTETPYLIWNGDTRSELKDYLSRQMESTYSSRKHEYEEAPSFKYTQLQNELRVGAIYIRIYNQQPEFTLENPAERLRELLAYIRDTLQGVDLQHPPNTKSWKRFLVSLAMILESIRNILAHHYGTESEFANQQSLKIICSLLEIPDDEDVPVKALMIIGTLTSNTICMNALLECGAIEQILPILNRVQRMRDTVLSIIHKLLSNSKVVHEVCLHGGLLYIMDIYYKPVELKHRTAAASVIGKMSIDKIYGQKLSLSLASYIPTSFLMVMREDPSAAVQMFDCDQETPELIWTPASRTKARQAIGVMASEFYEKKKTDRSLTWKPLETQSNIYDEGSNEVRVGGVYLRLFTNQPAWPLRDPRQFLIDLMDRVLLDVSKKKAAESLEMISLSCVGLSRTQPNVCDAVASTGHLAKLFPLLEHSDEIVRTNTIVILLALSESQACIDVLSSIDWAKHVMGGIKSTPNAAHHFSEFVYKAFSRTKADRASLVPQALKVDLPSFLMELTEKTPSSSEHGSLVKAMCINALKSMTYDRVHGDAVSRQLDSYPSWPSYRDQRQDLFVTASTIQHLLTAAPQQGRPLMISHAEATKSSSRKIPVRPQSAVMEEASGDELE
eukprot:TRINITY_DN10013_c0_g1_i2.p1 TRINITY_DN10013_c0_g1~~TRINITY_DN10013_c0_g1_i2.p1  ORF type:complete len:2234 (+),score=354.17 TRINITY_DN10013_c0_g1_i2:44-6745(+)